MTKEEIAQEIELFLNEYGLWGTFENFIKERGYMPSDVGLPDDL